MEIVPGAVAFNAPAGAPAPGTATGSFDFAPAGGVSASVPAADANAPIPRFSLTDQSALQWNAYSISGYSVGNSFTVPASNGTFAISVTGAAGSNWTGVS